MPSALPAFVTDSPTAARIRERGGLASVLALCEQHAGPKDVARALGVSTAGLLRWLQAQPADVQERLAEIQRARAAALAEETITLADDTLAKTEANPEAKAADVIKAANAAIGVRQWMAERMDRDRWSPKTADTTVTVTVATLHLDALRRRFTDVVQGASGEVPADATITDATLDALL